MTSMTKHQLYTLIEQDESEQEAPQNNLKIHQAWGHSRNAHTDSIESLSMNDEMDHADPQSRTTYKKLHAHAAFSHQKAANAHKELAPIAPHHQAFELAHRAMVDFHFNHGRTQGPIGDKTLDKIRRAHALSEKNPFWSPGVDDPKSDILKHTNTKMASINHERNRNKAAAHQGIADDPNTPPSFRAAHQAFADAHHALATNFGKAALQYEKDPKIRSYIRQSMHAYAKGKRAETASRRMAQNPTWEGHTHAAKLHQQAANLHHSHHINLFNLDTKQHQEQENRHLAAVKYHQKEASRMELPDLRFSLLDIH